MLKKREGNLEEQSKEPLFSQIWETAHTRLSKVHQALVSYLNKLRQRVEPHRKKEAEELLKSAEQLKGDELKELLLLAMERLGELHIKEIAKLEELLKSESEIVGRYTYKDTLLYPETYHVIVEMYKSASDFIDTQSISTAERLRKKQLHGPEKAIDSYVNGLLDNTSILINEKLTVSGMHESIQSSKESDDFFKSADNKKWTLKNLHTAFERRKHELEILRIREAQRQILERMILAQEGDSVLEGLAQAQHEFRTLCKEQGIRDDAGLQDFPPRIPFETSFYALPPQERVKTFLVWHIKEQYLKKQGAEYEV